MSATGFLIGVLNIGLWVLIWVLVGALIAWGLGLAGYPVPDNIRKLFLLVVAVAALIMLIQLLFGAAPFFPRLVMDPGEFAVGILAGAAVMALIPG